MTRCARSLPLAWVLVAILSGGAPASAQVLTPAVRAACGQDVTRFCANVPSGGGRILRCLAARQGDVSESCRAFLQQAGNVPAAEPAAAQGAETLKTPDGLTRTYFIGRPNAPGPLPTIFLLHGYPGKAEALARGSGLAQLGQKEGFVSVFPDGMPISPGNDGHGWNPLPPDAAATPAEVAKMEGFTLPPGAPIADDIGFFDTLIADLVRRGISDPKRIYIAGISQGGFMTLRLTCAGSKLFAAIGLIITGMPEATGAECHPAKPVPALVMKGTADTQVPFKGGVIKIGTYAVWPQERLVTYLRQLDGCEGTPMQSVLPRQVPFRVELSSWPNCAKGTPMEYYRVINGVHSVPPVPNLAQALWTFFRDKTNEAAAP